MSVTAAPAPPHSADIAAVVPSRLQSVDILRGAVMVLMAVDHVRVYFAREQLAPLADMSAGLFLTRWVTHFCAPLFVFLAGTGAFLYAARVQNRAQVSRFLLTRGALLVLLELTLIRFFWTFNFRVAEYNLAGVIWMLGWCMILLAALIWLPRIALAAFGFVVVFGHNMLPYIENSALWNVLHGGGPIGSAPVFVLYTLIPWVGVMSLGYVFGEVLRLDAERRRAACLTLGVGATMLFVVLRASGLYGNPGDWEPMESTLYSAFAFVNTAKYPASLQFLLMTLGPAIALMPLLENVRGRVVDALLVFGRTPLFYYLLHIPLIHVLALAIALVTGTGVAWMFANHPLMPGPPPAGWGFGVPMLWLLTAVVVVMLYFPCRWYAQQKARGTQRWMRYL